MTLKSFVLVAQLAFVAAWNPAPPVPSEYHVFLTACGSHLQADSAMATLRSVVLTSTSSMRAHVHITHDNSSGIQRNLLKPLELLDRHGLLDSNRVRITHSMTTVRKHRFKLCAMSRLFIAEEHKDLSGVAVYIDTDAVIVQDLSRALQQEAAALNGTRWCALAEQRPGGRGPALSSSFTWFGENGLNTGVMLVDLAGMRRSHLLRFVSNYSKPTPLGDQDLLNAYFTEHPSQLSILPCEWNYTPNKPCTGTPMIFHSSGPSRTLGTCGVRTHEPLWCAVRDWLGYPVGREPTPHS